MIGLDSNFLVRYLTLVAYRGGAGDFADYVIGERNARSGCERTATFDRAAADSARFELLRA